MSPKKEKLLNDTYYKWTQTVLYDLPLDGASDFVDPEIMGYGTAIDEKVLSISDYREMVNRQREQAVGLEMSFEITPVFRSISNKEDSAIFVDEIRVSIIFEGGKQELFLRLTTILEYINSKWIVVHLHGSMPTETTAEADTWLVNEWQRKNEELQKLVDEKTSELLNKNKELEIETALEKVRSSALAMKEPADMVEVCRIISDQLHILGVNDIRNIQTAIIDEAKSFYLNYQYFTAYDRSAIELADYNKHPKAREMAETMKRSANAFFSQSFDGEELNVFREYRKQDNQFPDPILEESSSLHFYFYSIGPGALGISTYNSTLSESDMGLFKRFRNVFELAYRRFTDIELAIAQAREARIEAALEKLRSRALAMRNSSEVGNVSTLLFLELEKMDINPSGFSIMIFDEEQDRYELWRAKEVEHQGAYETFSIKAMYDKFDQYVPGFGEELKSAWLKGNPFFIGEFRGEKRGSFLQANREMANYSDEVFEKMKKGWPDPTFWHLVFFKYGWFGVLQNEQLIKEDLLLIHRFAEVFDFAYTRFLDLQKAEAQAKEAQIELALERVRARTMGMQKSEELKEVIKVVYEQFVHLKINVDHAGFVVDYKPKGDWHFWIADEQDIPSKITHPYFDSVWAHQFNEADEKGIDFFATRLNFEEKNKFYNELLSYVTGLPEASKDFYLSCPGLAISTVLFDNVSLYIENFSGIPYSDEDNNTLMRFGKVFQQTYTRFLDLTKVEVQNKIIQADNDRKTKELEDARQLQLAMLPKELPQLPHFDIAVHMKTATEVGGDYYDFNIDINGTLTVVLGDATGHGMMSGMMVSIMKSFFISNKTHIELKQFFENANNSIKDMHLGRLMMSFMGVQIASHKLIATNAGMPSLIYFRNKSQKAGEFVSNNLPLGAMKGTKYSLKEIVYEKGDTLLLMSDGFAELKNKYNEQYGYPRITEEFRSVAHRNSDAIVEHLNNSASEWIKGIEPDDDVTFVVIKVK